jgi:nucleolar protein 9
MSGRDRKRVRPEDAAGGAAKRRVEAPAAAHPHGQADPVEQALANAEAMRVPPETVQYFEEISAALDQVAAQQEGGGAPAADDNADASPALEERRLLVSGALGEAVGQQVALALDPVCSRVLQRLLESATADELLTFTRALPGHALEVVTGIFGSHVVETLCEALQAPSAGLDLAQVGAALSPFCDELAPHAARLAVHPAASPALRAILSCLSGKDVSPSSAKGPPDPAEPADPAARAPKQLRRFTSALMAALGRSSDDYWSILSAPAGSAMLQALCLSHAGCPRDLDALLPRILGAQCGDGVAAPTLASVAPTTLLHVACDTAGSHLFEVVFRVASPAMRAELATSVFAGHLVALAQHPCGNFTLQAYLKALRDAESDAGPLATALSELGPCLPGLLQHSRGGVVVALLTACMQTKACERDASRALAKALAQAYCGESAAEGAGSTYLQELAPHLLRSVSGGTSKGGFSHQGCAILAAVLAMSPPTGRAYADSLAALSQPDALAAAQDASASRCLEAVLRGAKGNAPHGVARKMAATLAGHWSQLGLHPVGSHVVDAAFDGGDARTREAIVAGLAGAVSALAGQRHGPALMARLGVSEYKRDPAAWKKRHTHAAKVQDAFRELLPGGAEEKGPPAASKKPASVPVSRPRGQNKAHTSVAALSKEVQRALAGLSR